MIDGPYGLDFLQQVTDCHWGGGFVLVNIRITGFVSGSIVPPPYGTITPGTLPEGVTLMDKRQISRSQTSNPGSSTPTIDYFLWADGVLPLPDATNYFELITSPGAQPAFSPFITPFTYGNQFSVVLSGGFDFPSLAAANAAVPRANAVGAAEALPMWTSPTSDFFNFPTTFSAHSLTVTPPPVPSASTTFEMEYLFAVPEKSASFSVSATVPSNSSADGWVSVFTAPKRAVKTIGDLAGLADQSVLLATIAPAYQITSTAKRHAGTINVNGTEGTSPGLPPNAPPTG